MNGLVYQQSANVNSQPGEKFTVEKWIYYENSLLNQLLTIPIQWILKQQEDNKNKIKSTTFKLKKLYQFFTNQNNNNKQRQLITICYVWLCLPLRFSTILWNL